MATQGFALSMLECFRAHLQEAAVVSNCLELSVLLTRYEKVCAPLCRGALLLAVRPCSLVQPRVSTRAHGAAAER